MIGTTGSATVRADDGLPDQVDAVVVGAGQAGLAVSHLLTQSGVPHVVLERGHVGESWRTQRWDTFVLNTPNWANALPGAVLGAGLLDAFSVRDEVVAFLEDYAASSSAPIRQGVEVTSVEAGSDGHFLVTTTAGRVRSRNVVVCSGGLSRARLPEVARRVPDGVDVLTAATYRSPEQLADGAVVVVGSGQSGCQIAEDLLAAGREVYVCVSNVARVPRRYRGRDIIGWLLDTGFFDETVADLADPRAQFAAQPQVSGTDGGHTVSLQSLARDGAKLLGRLDDIEGTVLRVQPNVRSAIDFADDKCSNIKAGIDRFIAANGLDAPAAEPDPNEPATPDLGGFDELEQLDLVEARVGTIIWCVGFDGDLSYLPADVLDERGQPRHHDGVSDVGGLYFVGFPWLSRRRSGILLGIDDDARRIVGHLVARGA